jgi:exodeoxyribonuclease VII large subunit
LKADPPIFTVTEITEIVRRSLEETFPALGVVGEISNFVHHRSGHMYFSLKDEGGQIRCVLFRGNARRLVFQPENGLKVTALGRISFYPPQGSCQLVVEQLTPLGVGELEIAFQRLKERLDREGLFDPAHKRPLPRFPSHIGLVTSPTGAAVRDVVSTLERRWPLAGVEFHPVRVQGEGAAGEIAAALGRLDRPGEIDLILLVRGGGSLEDLWAFNEEIVARAIFAARVPVVTGVGHEIDFTIADFVADLRAPTPTGAAELTTPSREDLGEGLRRTLERMGRLAADRADRAFQRVEALLQGYGMRVPALKVESALVRLDELSARATLAAGRRLERAEAAFQSLQGRLESLSPLKAFERGYTVCLEPATGRVVRRLAEALNLSGLDVVFYDGRAHCTITGSEEGAPWGGRGKS